jgi:hypothetical protein
VPQPESHPSFQHLLDPQCMAAQRAQLEIFLNMLPRTEHLPRLYTMLQAEASSCGHPEVNSGTQVTTEAENVAPSIRNSNAELEKLLEGTAEDVASNSAEAACQLPACEAVEERSLAHENLDKPASESNHVCGTDAELNNPRSERGEGQQFGAGSVQQANAESLKGSGPSAGGLFGDNGVGSSCMDPVPVAQGNADISTGQPGDIQKHNDDGQKDQESLRAASDAAHDDSLSDLNVASDQKRDIAASVAVDSQNPASAVAHATLDGSVTNQNEAAAVSESPMNGKPYTVQQASSPTRNSEDKTARGRPDVTQDSQLQRGAPQAILSRNDIITRTSLQQSQLPAMDWGMVKAHLWTRSDGHRARLLQVRHDSYCTSYTVPAPWVASRTALIEKIWSPELNPEKVHPCKDTDQLCRQSDGGL